MAYAFNILKLKADIEVIWCKKTPRDDAFIHPLLIKQIEDNRMFNEYGVIAVVHRRVSRTENYIVCFNDNDAYPRRLIAFS